MFDDNYSEDLNEKNFEEEYLDDEIDNSKNVKKDFWDPPAKNKPKVPEKPVTIT